MATAFFHELDAWTEYWDVYHPETAGRYYFGDDTAPGLLDLIVPRRGSPPIFQAWTRRALDLDGAGDFAACAGDAATAAALGEVDDLVTRIFERHFGDAADDAVRRIYLRGMHRFATNTLPPALERADRIKPGDPRGRTAGHHTIDVDMMWFIWALQLEAVQLARADEARRDLHALLLAGVATGCSADFAWRGHRRTRPEYRDDEATRRLLLDRGLLWAKDFGAASREVHALYQLREWGFHK